MSPRSLDGAMFPGRGTLLSSTLFPMTCNRHLQCFLWRFTIFIAYRTRSAVRYKLIAGKCGGVNSWSDHGWFTKSRELWACFSGLHWFMILFLFLFSSPPFLTLCDTEYWYVCAMTWPLLSCTYYCLAYMHVMFSLSSICLSIVMFTNHSPLCRRFVPLC
jgi:hypothetical protein